VVPRRFGNRNILALFVRRMRMHAERTKNIRFAFRRGEDARKFPPRRPDIDHARDPRARARVNTPLAVGELGKVEVDSGSR